MNVQYQRRIARLEGAYEQMDHRVGDLAVEMRAGFAEMHAEFRAVREEMATLASTLRTEIASLQWRTTALIFGTWIATIGTILLHH